MSKLDVLCEIEGLTLEEMLENMESEGCCPAICINPGCEFTEDMEPDQDRGWCPDCKMNSVQSAAVLAGLI